MNIIGQPNLCTVPDLVEEVSTLISFLKEISPDILNEIRHSTRNPNHEDLLYAKHMKIGQKAIDIHERNVSTITNSANFHLVQAISSLKDYYEDLENLRQEEWKYKLAKAKVEQKNKEAEKKQKETQSRIVEELERQQERLEEQKRQRRLLEKRQRALELKRQQEQLEENKRHQEREENKRHQEREENKRHQEREELKFDDLLSMNQELIDVCNTAEEKWQREHKHVSQEPCEIPEESNRLATSYEIPEESELETLERFEKMEEEWHREQKAMIIYLKFREKQRSVRRELFPEDRAREPKAKKVRRLRHADCTD